MELISSAIASELSDRLQFAFRDDCRLVAAAIRRALHLADTLTDKQCMESFASTLMREMDDIRHELALRRCQELRAERAENDVTVESKSEVDA